MTETKPGADELRIRGILRRRGVGPDAEPATTPPPHAPDPDSWWNELYADEQPPARRPAPRIPDWWRGPTTELPEPEPEPEPQSEPDDEPEPENSGQKPESEDESAAPGRFDPQPGYWPRPHMPAFIDHTRDRAEEITLSPRTREGLYNATAATTGWALGLYHPLAAAIADCARQASTSGALTLGIGSTLLIAHVWDRRTRHWWPPLAWCARIPLATAVLALALWAPGT